MGRSEFLTPKAIAKRLKAKGLGRQWLYCQMCRKQCRDENGFKCHTMSEGHIRNMELFQQNPEVFIEKYSRLFEEKYMEYVSRMYRSTRVLANVVYNQVIRERNHVRMNGTRWETLSDFVHHLGRTGRVRVEDSPKGLYVTYLDRDGENDFKKGLKRKRVEAEAAAQDRHEREIQLQIQRAKGEIPAAGSVPPAKARRKRDDNSDEDSDEDSMDESEDYEDDDEDGSDREEGDKDKKEEASTSAAENGSVLEEADGKQTELAATIEPPVAATEETAADADAALPKPVFKVAFSLSKKQTSSVVKPSLLVAGQAEAARKNVDEQHKESSWLLEGIVVKVLKTGTYHKKKGVVKRVLDGKKVAEIELVDTGDVVKFHEDDLETVIPQVGRQIKVVKGAHRGSNAKLVSCDMAKYCVTIELENGKLVPGVAYEDVSKLAEH